MNVKLFDVIDLNRSKRPVLRDVEIVLDQV